MQQGVADQGCQAVALPCEIGKNFVNVLSIGGKLPLAANTVTQNFAYCLRLKVGEITKPSRKPIHLIYRVVRGTPSILFAHRAEVQVTVVICCLKSRQSNDDPRIDLRRHWLFVRE